uniref:C2H2-type domain-containing protein n=1 Tax=Octopus bimaculoides TaxID=37653 RepID=A0A0L8IEC6_OCTBM
MSPLINRYSTYCGKSLSESSESTRHKRIHKEEKRYQCDICGKSFSESNRFDSHKHIIKNLVFLA